MKNLIIHFIILSLALVYVVKEYYENHELSSNCSYTCDNANYYHEAEDRFSPLAMVKNPRLYIANS